MSTLTSQTTFTIAAALETITETADISLQPENSGSGAMRELHFPDNALPPLVYDEPPDSWENFDTGPLTARPLAVGQMTIADFQIARWPGYTKDNPVREIWKGSDTESHMPIGMMRRLWEYFANPPASGYITWWPKDRTSKGYNIEIIGLQAGTAANVTTNFDKNNSGQKEIISFDYFMSQQGYILGEVVFSFVIIGEAS